MELSPLLQLPRASKCECVGCFPAHEQLSKERLKDDLAHHQYKPVEALGPLICNKAKVIAPMHIQCHIQGLAYAIRHRFTG